MTKPVCVIGNANLDLVMGLLGDWPEEGTETFLKRADFRSGGSAANTALVLQQLGTTAGLVSAVGSDRLGDLLSADFSGPLDRIERINTQTGVTVGLLHPGAERSFFSFNGHLDLLDLPMVRAALNDWPLRGALSLVSGAFAMPGLLAQQEALLDDLQRAGAEVAIDPGWPGDGWTSETRSLLAGWLARADHVLMNDKEVCGMTAEEDIDVSLPLLAALSKPSVQIAVKMGARGAVLWSNGEILWAPAPEVVVFDSVGAGDAFNAGYLDAFSRGVDSLSALQFAVATASQTIARFPRKSVG